VLRALIAAALLTGAAAHFLGAPPDVTLGYILVLCFSLWFTWPVARLAARLMRRARRRRQRRTAPKSPAPAPHLTQINHHHHYYGAGMPPTVSAAPPRPDHTLPALPQRGRQQTAHDALYDTIDLDNTGP
jgi:ABC-type nickel/cobalt efflux system permease component RcnA